MVRKPLLLGGPFITDMAGHLKIIEWYRASRVNQLSKSPTGLRFLSKSNTIFTDAVRRGAQFLQWRVREYAGNIVMNASTIPRARASICERRARRRRLQHRQCQLRTCYCAIALLRN